MFRRRKRIRDSHEYFDLVKSSRNIMLTLALFSLLFCVIGLMGLDKENEMAIRTLSLAAGAMVSIVVVLIFRTLDSKEQIRMIKAATLESKNIFPLPTAFYRIRWIAYATKEQEASNPCWKFAVVKRLNNLSEDFVDYKLVTKNFWSVEVSYIMTFFGLQGCVLAAVTHEGETSSAMVFDTSVPSAGIYFGASFITDWNSDRSLTLAIVGTTEAKSLDDFFSQHSEIQEIFSDWYDRNNWCIRESKEAFDGAYTEHFSRTERPEGNKQKNIGMIYNRLFSLLSTRTPNPSRARNSKSSADISLTGIDRG